MTASIVESRDTELVYEVYFAYNFWYFSAYAPPSSAWPSSQPLPSPAVNAHTGRVYRLKYVCRGGTKNFFSE